MSGASSESGGEKTLQPTAKRLRDAARDGDVLRSRDMAIAAAMLVGATFLKIGGPWLFAMLSSAMRVGMIWNRTNITNFDPGQILLALAIRVLPPVLLLGTAMGAATLVAQLGLSGPGRFNFAGMAPRASRFNPGSGLSRMFGAQGWIEVGKGLAKLGLLGAIAWNWGRSRLDALTHLEAVGLSGQLVFGWQALTSLLLALSAGLVVIAMIDFPIQWIRRRRRLRMSLQEVKDENKEVDGNPENKMKIRQRQRALAMTAIAGAMKKAQFVITNPTHFAVALVYDPDLAPAPVVLAKGRGEKALAIRELAAEYGVPTLEYPALARSVYYTTREMQMIREELYAAVAGVLSFIFSLKRGEQWAAPVVNVPVELRFDADGRLDESQNAVTHEARAHQ